MGWLKSQPSNAGCASIQPSPPPLPPPISCPTTEKRTALPPPTDCPTPVSKVVPPCSTILGAILRCLCNGGRILFSLIIVSLIVGTIYWLTVNYETTNNRDQQPRMMNPASSSQQERSRNHNIAPMYHNVLAQTSQINFLQQQQQQQQQSNNQQQAMQSQPYYCYPANQQGMYTQNQYVQPYQQEPYGVNQQQQQQPIPRTGLGNLGQPLGQTSYNVPSIMQSQAVGYGSLPPHVLDQIRAYIGTPGPIFILPNNCPNPQSQSAPATTNLSANLGCPGIGINCPSSGLYGCPAGPCYPYPMSVPNFNSFANSAQNPLKEMRKNCGCFTRKNFIDNENSVRANGTNYFGNETEDHRCISGSDDTVCARKNCPSAINLQALASQLLGIQGIISCAATRLVLRKIPGSNVTTTIEETMERAKISLNALKKEQLLSETRIAQQINALLNLHMTANSPINVIPVLTTVQLKVNLLKAHVDSMINRRLSENQGIGGVEDTGNLDNVLLAMKSDQELRDLFGTLRQKECDERVNLNFAPYQSQRAIAESRLSNVQNKIAQLEEEMDRRRGENLPRSSIVAHPVGQQFSDPGCAAWYGYTGDINNSMTSYAPSKPAQNYESPDPFHGVQIKRPKRLNLQPHVGSPETTYQTTRKKSTGRSSRSRKTESDDDDCDENGKNSNQQTNAETRCCNCDKSSDDESADEGKKKLGVKINGARELVNMSANADDIMTKKRDVSVFKLSPNVVIVIDDSSNKARRIKNRDGDKNRKKTTRETIEDQAERDWIDLENPEVTGTKNLNGIPRLDGERACQSNCSPIEIKKKFKCMMKKDKVPDQENDRIVISHSTVKDSVEAEESGKNENYETAMMSEPLTNDEIDYSHDGPEPIREETVRMITKIHYEPTVFRGYHNDETPEREKVIEERFKNSFTEDSLKSTSMESNCTPEPASFHIENYQDASMNVIGDSKKNRESHLENEPRVRNVSIHEQPEEIDDNHQSPNKSKIDNIDEKDGRISFDDVRDISTDDRNDESRNDLISGALTTIGNHVASFGSIIGKIATLKLHRADESSHEILSIDENEENNVGTSQEKSSRKNDNNREIGRWKYIRFSDVKESTSTLNEDENLNLQNETYTLPRIKHSVIEDKSKGGKYVVMEKSSKRILNRQLGEPYKTGRSLVIRSRLKSPEGNLREQSGPFTVVKGPKQKNKSCLPLSLVNVRSLRKNQIKNSNELRTSEKFWLKPETRQTSENNTNTNRNVKYDENKCMKDDFQAEKCKLVVSTLNNEAGTALASGRTATAERVVKIHDYSKIQVNR